MGAYLYDEAIVDKLQKWTKKAKIQVYGPDDVDRVFEITADTTNDQSIKLPIITVSRPSGYTVINTTKKPMTFDGVTLEADTKKALQLNAIPIELNYKIDIYARYLKEADLYARDLVFNFINHPGIMIKIPYKNASVEHCAHVILDNNIEDTSSSAKRLNVGQISRLTLSIKLDEAYLWDCRIRDVISIIED